MNCKDFHSYLMCIDLQKKDYKMALKKYIQALRYLDVCWEMQDADAGKVFILLIE